MKKFFIALAVIFLSFTATAAEDKRYMTVDGNAEIKVTPDRVTITLGYEKQVKELASAKNELEQVMSSAVAFCKKNGVAEKNIQTSYVSISPFYRDDYNDGARFPALYYRLSQMFTITLDDISKYEKIIYPLLDMGINTVSSVEFSTSELRQYRDKARIAAIKAAQEKAKLLTDAAGIKLGKPVNISENSGLYRPMWGRGGMNLSQNVSQNYSQSSGIEEGGGVSAGMVSVSAAVTITYELE